MQGGKNVSFFDKQRIIAYKEKANRFLLFTMFVCHESCFTVTATFFINKVWRMKREESESEFTQEVNRSPSGERCCGQCVNVQWTNFDILKFSLTQ